MKETKVARLLWVNQSYIHVQRLCFNSSFCTRNVDIYAENGHKFKVRKCLLSRRIKNKFINKSYNR